MEERTRLKGLRPLREQTTLREEILRVMTFKVMWMGRVLVTLSEELNLLGEGRGEGKSGGGGVVKMTHK